MKNKEMDIEAITKRLEQEGCRVLTEDELRLKVNGGWGRSSSSSSSSSSSRSGGSSSSRSSSSGRSSSRSSGGGNSSKRNSGSTETTKTKTSFGQKVSNAISSIKSWAQSHAPTNRMDKGYSSSSKKDNDTAGTSQQHASTSDTSRSREVENTNHAVANARPGDTITRSNGTKVTLKQSDIDYAKAHDTAVAEPSSPRNNSISIQSLKSNHKDKISTTNSNTTNHKNKTLYKNNINDVNNNKSKLSTKANKKKGLISLFSNDCSDKIFTTGLSATGTVTTTSGGVSAGIYVNPKNDKLYEISERLTGTCNPIFRLAGGIIKSFNTEELGLYAGTEVGAGIGISGSVVLEKGEYRSLDDMKGFYDDFGISGGPSGVSAGLDGIFNKNKEFIGITSSIGFGAGTLLEVHDRVGMTGSISIFNSKKE